MKTLLDKDNPSLRVIAEPVAIEEFQQEWLKQLAVDMINIMREKGAVGVAAPQIGICKRVIVFGTAYTKRRKPDTAIPDTVLINPSLKILSEKMESGYEGCLNSGELMGEVPRAFEIEYSGYDLEGSLIKKKATGLEARILQHEVDHLDGVLFFDRVVDKKTLTTYDELQKKTSI